MNLDFSVPFQPGLCNRNSITSRNALEHERLLDFGTHRSGDYVSVPKSCASARLLWPFDSHYESYRIIRVKHLPFPMKFYLKTFVGISPFSLAIL